MPPVSHSRTVKWLRWRSRSLTASTNSSTRALRQRERSRKPGTMCTPSTTMRCASSIPRAIKASMPTDTALVCSMKPTLLRSVSRGTGTRTAEAASNEDVWMAGMSSGAKKARIVWRTMSVPMTRVMPRRCASSVARVLLPTPVAPPMSTMSGVSRRRSLCHWRKRPISTSPCSSPSCSQAILRRSARVRAAGPRRRKRRSTAAATA